MSYNHYIDINDEVEMESISSLKIAIKAPCCFTCKIIPNILNQKKLVKINCEHDYCVDCLIKHIVDNIIKNNMYYCGYNELRVKCPSSDCTYKSGDNVNKILSLDEYNTIRKNILYCQRCRDKYHATSRKIYGEIHKYCERCIIHMIKNHNFYNDDVPYDKHMIKSPYPDEYLGFAKDIISEEMFDQYIKLNIQLLCYVCHNNYSIKNINKCDCGNQVCKKCLTTNINTNHAVVFKKPDYNTHSIKCTNPDCDIKILTKSFMDTQTFKECVKQVKIKPRYCIENNCNGILNDGTCEKCYSVTCQNCHQKFHDSECKDEVFRTLEEVAGHGGATFRNCPKCDELIFKNEGCENMFCWNCSITFNWYDEYDSYDDDYNSDGESYTKFNFTGYNFYKLFKKARKKGIHITPNDFEDGSSFDIEKLYNSDDELSPDSDEEEIKKTFDF